MMVTSLIAPVACRHDAARSSPGPSPLTDIAGTWTGTEAFQSQPSGPPDHCIVQYFRNSGATFVTPVVMTLDQTGETVSGTYSASDVVAFRPFSCQVRGTLSDGHLTLEMTACAPYTFGLNPSCLGTLQRLRGQLQVSLTSSSLWSAGWRIEVNSQDLAGSPTGVLDWRTTLFVRR